MLATISLSIRDGLGTTNTARFYATVADTVTAASLAAEVAALAGLVDGLIDGQIESTKVSLKGGAVGGSADSASRVEQGLVLDFRNPATDTTWGEFVPALADANIAAGKPAPTPVNALAAHMIAGATGIAYTTSQGGALGAVSSAFVSFRQRRKQLERTSFEVL
jgi:hypothetical protein